MLNFWDIRKNGLVIPCIIRVCKWYCLKDFLVFKGLRQAEVLKSESVGFSCLKDFLVFKGLRLNVCLKYVLVHDQGLKDFLVFKGLRLKEPTEENFKELYCLKDFLVFKGLRLIFKFWSSRNNVWKSERLPCFTAREPVRMLAGAQATTRYAGV